MKTVLLHKDIFIPKSILEQAYELLDNIEEFAPGFHVHQRCKETDRSHKYNNDNLMESLMLPSKGIFEIEVTIDDNKQISITKICERMEFVDDTQDICYAFSPLNKSWKLVKIKTAWLNARDDYHKTLNTKKYCSKEDFIKLTAMKENKVEKK